MSAAVVTRDITVRKVLEAERERLFKNGIVPTAMPACTAT